MHVRIVDVDVPGRRRRPAEVDRRGVAPDADIRRVQIVGDVPLDGGGVGAGEGRVCAPGRRFARDARTSGILEQCIGQPGGQRQRRRADAVVEGLRVGAVDVWRLIPTDADVVFSGLRSVYFEALVVVADIVGPEVDVPESILAAEVQPAVGKWAGADVAVFVVLAEARLALAGDAVLARIVEEEAATGFDVTVECPPGVRNGSSFR